MPTQDLSQDDIRSAMPAGGLFDGKDWLLSPRPFALSQGEAKSIERMGHPLTMFQKACDRIYRASAAGKAPAWIAEMLDAGKPDWMVEAARVGSQAEVIPRVLRPDLLLTDEGWAVSELDSLPGGIGLTAWLAQTYGAVGWDILGGEKGMLEGFASVVPEKGRIWVSDESSDYRPEMQWLVEQLAGGRCVERAEEGQDLEGEIYRFFELFDWESIPAIRDMVSGAAGGKVKVTPPLKPHLEEKLWLALLWAPALKTFWEKELRGSHLALLQKLVPFGWALDDSPLPPVATLPRLDAHSWQDVANFTQRERELVLKISGFSEEAWGSRGVYIGHDLSAEEWSSSVERAVAESGKQGWMMQEFKNARVVEHPYYDPESGIIRIMEGRVRVCPYFFSGNDGKVSLGGCLATIVPKDKKKIHGMKDGILVPCVVGD